MPGIVRLRRGRAFVWLPSSFQADRWLAWREAGVIHIGLSALKVASGIRVIELESREIQNDSPKLRTVSADRAFVALASVFLFAFAGLTGCSEPQSTKKTAPAAPAARRSSPTADTPAPRSSNLIIVTLDTTRADALGSYGQPLPVTPNIDQLARRGVLFEQVTSSNPETLPSHATIMTGKFPFSHGVRSNAGYSLSKSNQTLAEHLKSHGYRTGAEIASIVLARTTQIARGFDHYRGVDSPGVRLKNVVYEGHPNRPVSLPIRIGSDISNAGIEFIRNNHNQSFFLWLHFFDAHYPYAPRREFSDKARGSLYHGEVAGMDFEIGRVIAEIERLGLSRRTLIAVTADHGEGLGEHGEATHPYFVYDSTVRVPLVLAGLGNLPEKRRVHSHVRTVDIAPTLIELLDLPPMSGSQGASLVPLIRGTSQDLALTGYGESAEFMLTFGLPMLRYVRDGDWKYIHKTNPELYDIANDPSESKNLAAQHPKIVARLSARLDEMLASAAPAPGDANRAIDSSTAKQLAALGYAAQSPQASAHNAVNSTVLAGVDPNEKLADIARLTNAASMIDAGKYTTAREVLQLIADQDPENTYVLGLLTNALTGEGNNRQSIGLLAKIHAIDPGQLVYANNYGYLLATIDDDTLRDGSKALEVARSVVATGGEADPNFLDTLAAAQAETGDFGGAVRTESTAIDMIRANPNQKNLLALLEAHRETFRSGRPLREPAMPASRASRD